MGSVTLFGRDGSKDPSSLAGLLFFAEIVSHSRNLSFRPTRAVLFCLAISVTLVPVLFCFAFGHVFLFASRDVRRVLL